MREFSTPLSITIPSTGNLTDDVVTNGRDFADTVVFSRRTGDEWSDVTAAEFLDEVQAVAKGLVAAGVELGDRVAILSKTRYEWTLLDYAIWFAGAVTVPIYETSSAEQIGWILQDSGARAIVAEGPDHLARVREARRSCDLTELQHVWSLQDNAVDVLGRLGSDISDDVLEQRRTTATPQDVATLIYTSGTTGKPKGCMLTHGNFMFELGVAVDELADLFDTEDASTLLFLPLAHVFARIIQVGCVKSRAKMGHSADIKNLVTDLGEFRPTFILAVPRVFEKVFNSAKAKAEGDGKGKIFDRAARVAIDWSRAQDEGGAGLALKAQHAIFDKLVYGKLRAALGGRCLGAISGGAPLGERLGHFFRGIGVTVFEGYGLTETTAAASVNHDEALRIGTVGRPLPGVQFRIADDGEVLIRGGIVMRGYWKNEDATKEAIDSEGFFHTGDLGELDSDGFLKITGRKKEILVTAGGKNVAPAVLEDRLRAHRLVSQCIVVGDQRPFIGALITLDQEALPQWLESKGKPADQSLEQLREDPELKAEIDAAVKDANKAVSQAEAIKKFTILTTDFTEDNGMLTPSLKLKRAVVMKEFGNEVESLYSR